MQHFSRRELLLAASLGAGSWLAPQALARAKNNKAASPPGERPPQAPFRVAILSDAQLMDDHVNPRFGQQFSQSLATVEALAPDFVVFAGNLWRMGTPEGIKMASAQLKTLSMPVAMVPGEHDWYADLGATWQELNGPPYYSFAHQGVHVVVLMSMHTKAFWQNAQGRDIMNGAQRMHTVAALTAAHAGPFFLGQQQLAWLAQDLSQIGHDTPVLVFSHGPLFDYYAPWHMATADAAQAAALLGPYARVTLVHGHCQQPLLTTAHGYKSYGIPSTAWSWPMAPTGVNAATAQVRRGLGESGLGFGELVVQPSGATRMIYRNLEGTAVGHG